MNDAVLTILIELSILIILAFAFSKITRHLLARIVEMWRVMWLLSAWVFLGSFLTFSKIDWINLIVSIFVILCYTIAGWLHNDYYDYETDKLSNAHRPTISGAINRKLLNPLFYFFSFLGLIPLFFINTSSIIAYALLIVVAIVYSQPPFRFKKYPFPSLICLSSGLVLSAMLGFFMQNGVLTPFVIKLMVLGLVGGISNASYKDLKDAYSDKATGVSNLVTKYGIDKMKRSIAISQVITCIVIPLIFQLYWTLPITIILGAIMAYLLMNYTIEKKASIVHQLDILNGLLVLIVGIGLWLQQIS